ncbi:hypothetical protein [Rickettsiella massiliensis]|uniref:hypothetical protein n=1 Tax=Rickettsiella massiliensis TaxID=676517 RepID=UPI00029B0833|nr:hypothetical protein [Rickettsiella massiliensis]
MIRLRYTHLIRNALFKIIFVKEYIFNSIVNLDFLKSPKAFKTSFDEKIKHDQAMHYIGPDHEKYSKNLKCVSMFFADKKMEPKEQSVDKDKNPTPTTKTC